MNDFLSICDFTNHARTERLNDWLRGCLADAHCSILGVIPPGPTAFYGEIVLRSEKFHFNEQTASITDKLSFTIAHELTHVFDMLRILVPAIRDWPTFWEEALQEGTSCDNARLLHQYDSRFVDNYGSENELAMIAQYWPTRAEKWFKAFMG